MYEGKRLLLEIVSSKKTKEWSEKSGTIGQVLKLDDGSI